MLPPIASNLAIAGPGANLLTIDAQGNSGIFSIDAGFTVVLSGLSLVDGNAPYAGESGGGVFNRGTLTMTACTVSGNTAQAGGGIGNTSQGTVALFDSTVSGNTATAYGGGGIANFGTMTIVDCTIANNSTTASGGGIANYYGSLSLADCTVAGNSAGGIDNDDGLLTLDNTIVASDSGGEVSGAYSGGGNLVGGDPKLGALRYNGGPTQTMALLSGSPAIGAGTTTLVPPGVITDERGSPRIKGGAVDIGAFESGPTTIVVTGLTDVDSGTINLLDPNGITLREAIAFANADPAGGDTILFSPLVTGSIDLSEGALPTITTTLSIDGPGANVLTIDGQGESGILSIGPRADVTISGLSLVDGSATFGGAIENSGGALNLLDCSLSGNTASVGGGLDNRNGTATLYGCTISGNSATSYAGAVRNDGGSLSLSDCTISGNTAPSRAGLVLSGENNTLTACTVSANIDTSSSSNEYTAGVFIAGEATINDTIVADNSDPSGASDISGRTAGSNNLIGPGGSGGLSNGEQGNIVLTNAGMAGLNLAPLGYYGGPTRTRALLPGSRAIGGVTFGELGVTADQRGFALDSPAADIGAFQYQGPPPGVTITGPKTGTAQVAATFTLTATDPTPAQQNGTFNYTIDWNGDGSDIQTIQGPASLQITHAFLAAGSYTPSVTVLDEANRSSSPAALAAPVVVAGLGTATFGQAIEISPVTIVASTTQEETTVMNTINNAPPAAWNTANSVTVSVAARCPGAGRRGRPHQFQRPGELRSLQHWYAGFVIARQPSQPVPQRQ